MRGLGHHRPGSLNDTGHGVRNVGPGDSGVSGHMRRGQTCQLTDRPGGGRGGDSPRDFPLPKLCRPTGPGRKILQPQGGGKTKPGGNGA